ncbi:kinase-like domain-containing protein [Talaromyces proteolyticus]|uniref:Kinase-like domain-containing protein n=1 Tax=Talaromyces proteolyticus TaxID=1131652 RepID=A0AAD4L3B4_9EURO|nr:kinase-like domain-containing protein [Talaromyces proteolyticus]KAH8703839.1 kinase-like domain-containing protein [Talaromyces proteolyticus]
MSVSFEKASSLASRFRDALPSVLKKSRHTEIWGVDIKHAEWQVLEVILEKFLRSRSAIPALQVPRAIASLEKTLEWRRFSDPRALLTEAESILPDLDLCHITLNEGQYVLWVNIDEMTIKGYSAIHQSLTTSQGLVQLGLAVMERLSTLLLDTAASSDRQDYSASCVIEFKIRAIQNAKKGQQSFQEKLCNALEELVVIIRRHYPTILGKAYIINFRDEYLAYLDIDEALLRDTVLLKNPVDLHRYLGSQLPPRYGGTGESFGESDFLHRYCLARHLEGRNSLETPEVSAAASTETEKTGVKKETAASTLNTGCACPEGLETEEQKPRLIYSEIIGPPSIILDPGDLQRANDLCPGKMGARIVFADSDMVVKFGYGVRLGEAEALHLASTRTTIATPRLLSAYILDGFGYIVMSYEAGEPLQQYWDRVSKAEQNRILENLRDYVNQMRDIQGDFIGGLDRSPCRDGIFEAGYGDYTRYCYGPYPSEESFDEGIVQALRDRLPSEVLEREHDIESNFFNSEYMLYQTVRGLKNHKIVFTHADLHPGNIIVRTDGTIVLLDWGLAGFWPEYWEFYRAMHNSPWRASWDRMVEKFIPPFYVEYSVIKRVFATVWN